MMTALQIQPFQPFEKDTTMAVIQIRRVRRENARLFIVLASWTGKGKTFSAIQLGYGLANYNPSKLGMLDTENRRGSLYDDILEKPPTVKLTTERFLIGDLNPPFTPERYMASIDEFQDAGVEVLIIDSATHEWEGTGGCQEIAEAGNPKVPNWNEAKKRHKRFMEKMLQADMHIICCVRAREKSKPERNPQKGNKLEFVDMGLQPIQEKNFMFEATASLMMYDEGRRQEIIKCPAALVNILGRTNDYLTAEDGYRLRQWVDGALQLDPVVERFRNRLISNAEGGLEHINTCWAKTPPEVQTALGQAFYGTLVESAKTYDELKAAEEAARADAEREEGRGSGTVSNTGAGATHGDTAQAAAIVARATANGASEPQQTVTVHKSQGRTLEQAAGASPSAAASAAVSGTAKETPAPATAATKEPAARPAKPPVQQELNTKPGPPAGTMEPDPVF